MYNDWEVVIGLETHAQVLSKSKLFSGASTGLCAKPNAHACFIDLAMPGTLPVLNIYCVEQAVRFGLAVNATIHTTSNFDRKNYFYPDLAAGYQISQFFHPIVTDGYIMIDTDDGEKKINICRAHLEQDAGKSVHDISPQYTCVDFNRAGIALLEIVTEPDLKSAAEAIDYIKKLQSILRYTGVCSGDLEDGALRCDANVSVKKKNNKTLGTRCEIKNLNSLTGIAKAIEYEAQYQIECLEKGETVKQATKLFDVVNGVTRYLRDKETAADYGYFADPNLPPVLIKEEFIKRVQNEMPELPHDKKRRYCREYGLSNYDAEVLIAEKATTKYFEDAIKIIKDLKYIKTLANWITTELFGRLNKLNTTIEQSPVNPDRMGALINLIIEGVISNKIAKQVFDIMFDTDAEPLHIVESKGLKTIDDASGIEKIINEILNDNPDKVTEYKNGKHKLYGYFVGQVMQKTQGKANPETVNKILGNKLNT